MVAVSFLGKSYNVSEDIIKFLEIRKYEGQICNRLFESLLQIVNRNSKFAAENAVNYFEDDVKLLQKMMEKEGDSLLQKLLELGVYDSTITELLDGTKYDLVMKVVLNTGRKFVEVARANLEAKQRGSQLAYQKAASTITGSGVSIFTNSLSSAMIYSFVEGSLLKKQAQNADKQYANAIKELDRNCQNAYDNNLRNILVNTYYPELAELISTFSSKLVSNFLLILTKHNKFNFEEMSQYDQSKSNEVLKNIDRVTEKWCILENAFVICPFNVSVYKEVIKHDLLDSNIYETLCYFGFKEILSDEIVSFCKRNVLAQPSTEKIVELYMLHANVDETTALKMLCKEEVNMIVQKYQQVEKAIKEKSLLLCSWIEQNICSDLEKLVVMTDEEVRTIVRDRLDRMVDQNKVVELIDKHILSISSIAFSNNSKTLEDVNDELLHQLTECIVSCDFYYRHSRIIVDNYLSVNSIIVKKDNALLEWIRRYISADPMELTNMTSSKIEEIVRIYVGKLAKQNVVQKLIEKRIISIEKISIENSIAKDVESLNEEIVRNLSKCIFEIVEEEKKINHKMDTLKQKLSSLELELKQMGFFKFSAKRDLKKQIEELTIELNQIVKSREAKW